MPHVHLNGSLVDAHAATVSVADPGFTLGDGVFTTLLVEQGRPLALERNLRRLLGSAERIGIPIPDAALLRGAVASLLAADGVQRARLRITLTACTVLVAHAPARVIDGPATVVTLPWRRNEHGPLAGVKSLSFGDYAVASRQLAELGADEGIVANTAGDLCEAVGSNVFLGVGGRLWTPPLASGCLPGVIREIVCERLAVSEEPLPLALLGECDEAFLTSATRKVQPIGLLDGRRLRAPGPLTRLALEALAAADEPDA